MRLVPDEKVEVTDLISEVQPRLSTVLKAAYQVAIIHCPAAWRLTYKMLGNPKMIGRPAGNRSNHFRRWFRNLPQGGNLKNRIYVPYFAARYSRYCAEYSAGPK